MDEDFTDVDQMLEYRRLTPDTQEQPEPEALN